LLSQAAHSDEAVADVVNPNTGQPTVLPLTPRRADGQVEYGPRRTELLAENMRRVERTLDDEAATGPFDLLGLLASAVRVATPPATIIVVTSGLSTAGAVDLQDLGWNAKPSAVAAQLKRRGLLPDLAGLAVVFTGLGDVAGRQPSLPLPQQATLVAYWLAICHAGGAVSCRADDLTRATPQSRSKVAVPVVPVPEVTPVRGPSGSRGISVPDDLLFTIGSARLLPGADSILRPLAARAVLLHLLISISGFASPDGSASYNVTLSRARALSVAARFRALGVPARQIIRVHGAGTAGKTLNACFRNGQFDETICAQMRRVLILLSNPPAPIARSL
jgi:outer membrane protein OmpA-like peptidoglycan-associated protein